MKPFKKSNYRWLLDTGHFGWDNAQVHRKNCHGLVSRLADKLWEKRIGLSLIHNPLKDNTTSEKVALANRQFETHRNALYLSVQVCECRGGKNNVTLVTGPPDFMTSGQGKEVTGAALLKSIDWLAKNHCVANFNFLNEVKPPVITVTFFLHNGARYPVRKFIQRQMAGYVYELIQQIENQKVSLRPSSPHP